MSKRQRRAKSRKLRRSAARRAQTSRMASGVAALTAVTVGAACSSASAADFNASMVKDLNTDPESSLARNFFAFDEIALFVADDPTYGRELWKTDGTRNGTVLLKDIKPGPGGAFDQTSDYNDSDFEPVRIGGTLYFTANDGTNGGELWRTDGTSAGTRMVTEIDPNGSSEITEMTKLGSTLYFGANDGTRGRELWKSDGTAAGTQLVKDINPGSTYNPGRGSFPSELTAVGNTLYFSASDGTTGRELWKSDGTTAGTQLVRDIRPGGNSSEPRLFTEANGTVFFRADDGERGNELWRTDGTSAGTRLVSDIAAGYPGSYLGGFEALGSTLFFSANDRVRGRELWKTDGTEAGTQLVADINASSGGGPYGGSSPSRLTAVGGTLFFNATDGTTGRELWKSDGTAAGTQLVKDMNPGAPSSSRSYGDARFPVLRGKLYFSAGPGGASDSGRLWESDGTEAGTRLVKNVVVDDYGSRVGSTTGRLIVFNDGLLFSGSDDATGTEPWISDGTANGTGLLRDINTRTANSNPNRLTDFDGTLFFQTSWFGVNESDDLWKTDGTEAGTELVDLPSAIYGVSNLTNVEGTLFFTATTERHGTELWKSDGTAVGTQLVKDIRPFRDGYNGGSYPSNLTAIGNTVFFSANDGTNGKELWKSDGTAAGTQMVRDIRPANEYGYGGSSEPSDLAVVGEVLFFAANDGESGRELWRSDGTAAGTRLLKDVRPATTYGGGYSFNPGSYTADLTTVGNTLFFTADDGSTGRELWKSDGTEEGTRLVKDIDPGGGDKPSSLTAVGNTLFFAGNDGIRGRELWKSDGTEAGTRLVKDINPDTGNSIATDNSYYSVPPGFADVKGKLYFAADNGVLGSELWTSDGTEQGTVLVKDLLPGPEGSTPAGFVFSGGQLFFSAKDDAHGIELWRTRGGTTDPPEGPQFSLPKTGKVNLKTGTVTVTISLPEPGEMVANEVRSGAGPALVQPAKATARKSGPVSILLKPSKAGMKKLKGGGAKIRKFTALMRFTFSSLRGETGTRQRNYVFKRR